MESMQGIEGQLPAENEVWFPTMTDPDISGLLDIDEEFLLIKYAKDQIINNVFVEKVCTWN